ncbi:NUDIX hydrolase [Sphingobacterium suaedae]|uniref:NUDIX domain-containing protein n=1 Tax=Sphingobacterium suaedae TaxID=1686402 RepID=A0ABW5KEN5_9SPHI
MKVSAGILLFKEKDGVRFYFLVHPGGPFWKHKDTGAWSIPKGELDVGEDPLQRARCEFEEETGQSIAGEFCILSPIRQKGGKEVQAWAVKGDVNMDKLQSNSFTLEWPPRSGKLMQVPEVDRWEWFTVEQAIKKINPAQVPFIREVEDMHQLQ